MTSRSSIEERLDRIESMLQKIYEHMPHQESLLLCKESGEHSWTPDIANNCCRCTRIGCNETRILVRADLI